MLNLKKILPFFFLLLFFKADAQEIFQKTYFDSIHSQGYDDIVLLNDSTYFVVGNHSDTINKVLLSKVNKKGDIIWNRQYIIGHSAGGQQILKINDNSFAICGLAFFDSTVTYDYFIMNVDSNGIVNWMSGFNNNYYIQTKSISCASGGYLSIFKIYGGVNAYYNVLVKLDNTGGILWQKEFHRNERMDLFSIAESQDRSIYLGGASQDTIGFAVLIKTDSTGNIIWNKLFAPDTSYYSYISSIAINNNGNLSLLGDYFFGSSRNHMFLLETDTSGSIVEANSLNFLNNYFSHNHKFISDNRIGILSENTLLIIDSLSNLEFAKRYIVQSGMSTLVNFLQTSDKGFVFAGTSGISPYSAWIVKTDSTGNAGCFQSNLAFTVTSLTVNVENYSNFPDSSFQFSVYSNNSMDSVILNDTVWCQSTTQINFVMADLKDNIKIQPNPFFGYIQIAIPNFSIYNFKECEIYDLTARKIFNISTENQSSVNIDCTNIENGIYLLKLKGEKYSATFKIIKN